MSLIMAARNDVQIETYSDETLMKYGITDEKIGHSCVDAFWDDPFDNWLFPQRKDKLKNTYNSFFGLFMQGIQKSYNRESIAPNVLVNHPNAKSFLCFYNPNSNNNSENNNIKDFKYAGTITVCAPDINSEYGFNDLFNEKYIENAIDYSYKKSFLSTIKFSLYQQLIEVNKSIMMKKIQSVLKSYWFMEMVNINPKYQNKGIGSIFIQDVFNNHVIPISKKFNDNNDYNGFCLLGSSNARNNAFYKRNGYQFLTEFKLPKKISDDGKLILDDVRYIWLLWHWDEKKCSDVINILRTEYGIEPEYKMLSLAKCVKYQFVPKRLQWIPIRLTLFILLVLTGVFVFDKKQGNGKMLKLIGAEMRNIIHKINDIIRQH